MLDIRNINIAAKFATLTLWYVWILIVGFVFVYTMWLYFYTSLSENFWDMATDEEVTNNLYNFLVEFYANKNMQNIDLQNNKTSVLEHIKKMNYEEYKVYYVYLLTNGLRKRVELMNSKETNDKN